MLAHHLAEPDKGSGIAMICTFGDVTDVVWWRELDLPTRAVIGWDGRLLPDAARVVVAAGAAVRGARGQDRAQRPASGSSSCCASRATWTASRSPITHPVKFYEKGDRPLEIVTTRQWYIRNGGRDLALRDALLDARRGADLAPAVHAASATTTGSRA